MAAHPCSTTSPPTIRGAPRARLAVRNRGDTIILVDQALREREAQGRPVRVGLVGAGFMAHGIARQLQYALPGMRLVAVANRAPANAHDALRRAGHRDVREVANPEALDRAVANGATTVTVDLRVLCAATTVDILIEATAR